VNVVNMKWATNCNEAGDLALYSSYLAGSVLSPLLSLLVLHTIGDGHRPFNKPQVHICV